MVEPGDSLATRTISTQYDIVTQTDDIRTIRICRRQIDPGRQCHVGRIRIGAADENAIACSIDTQHLSAHSVDNTRCITHECTIVNRTDTLVISVTTSKGIVPLKLGGDSCCHCQRNAAVEVGIGRECHAVQCHVDVRLCAVDRDGSAALAPFYKGDTGERCKVQHTIVGRQAYLHEGIISPCQPVDGDRIGARERQHLIFIDTLWTGKLISSIPCDGPTVVVDQ